MDQIKIGKFIAECRKKNGLTQLQLAEKLNITDRAISKWENGKTMPDSSLMVELCDILQITPSDLLNGEVISTEEYKQKMETQLLELLQQKETSEKRLLKLINWQAIAWGIAYILGTACLVHSDFNDFWYLTIFIALTAIHIIEVVVFTKFFQNIGYYRCIKCGHTYTPSYRALAYALPARHKRVIMRCPECKKFHKHEWVSSNIKK